MQNNTIKGCWPLITFTLSNLALLEKSSDTPDLGVLVDNNLDWKHHIKQVCKKISSGAWAIARLRNYVNTCTLKLVYYSLIYSHLSYCINTWGSASSCNLKPFKILQKHIIRLIAGSEYRAPSSPLFSQLQILLLEDIYTTEVAKHINKFSTN